MGKKRRGTAKTGDQAVYKSRSQHQEKNASHSNYNSDDDAMYDKVDRYHNRKEEEEHIRFDDDENESDDDDGISKKENVLDLGAAIDDSDEDSSSSSDDDDDASDGSNNHDNFDVEDDELEQELSSSDDDDDELENMKEENVRDWGQNVYGGDTADLEIGQEEDDAYLEEEAAKEVQAARYKDMKEDDFMLDFDQDGDDESLSSSDEESDAKKKKKKKKSKKASSKSDDLSASTRDFSKLSRSDKRRLLKSHHPELLPLMSHFSEVIQEWDGKTRVVASALLDGDDKETPEAVGATPMGLQYLVTKSALQTSVALNVAMYLLLKSEQESSGPNGIMEEDGDADMLDIGGASDEATSIESHPIMARLKQWNSLAEKLEDKVESKIDTLSDQLENLVKASALMKSDGDGEESSEGEGEVAVDGSDEEHGGSTPVSDVDAKLEEASSSSEQEEEEEELAKGVLNEARFGLRPQEIDSSSSTKKKSKKKRVRRAMPSDFGDDEDEEDRDADKKRKATLSLASTVNAIEQRSQSRKRRSAPNVEDVDEPNEDEEALRRGLEMMEAEMGGLESDEDGGGANNNDDYMDDELDDGLDEDGGGFYEQVKKSSKAKKAMKKSMYEVAPKYPVLDDEVEGERAISRAIMKNRGLVAHKNKLNRNPRVKKREQYRKAVIRRKGAVREVRTEEGHKYGGETTGIKSGLSRSRKLGVR